MSAKSKCKAARRPTSTNAVTPRISEKDQKIVWSRAAGRCSFKHCRRLLTFDTASGSTQTLGEMCHIVGEKTNSPRGRSRLSDRERNSYSNLLLLCAHHHKIIDADESEYPIELLHAIKDEHEQWVSETLGSPESDPDELVYSDLIDSITVLLQLDHWWWFIDNAARDLIPVSVADAQETLNRMRLGVIWPHKKPLLRKAIVRLLDAFDEFIEHYMTNADFHRNDNFYGPDHSYRRYAHSQDHQDKCEEKERVWSGISFLLLCNFTLKLNRFADAVRRFSNPLYFRLHGKFLIHDSLGYRFGGHNTLCDPSSAHIRAALAKYSYTLKNR